MIRHMVSVFDSAAQIYGQPFFVTAIGAAIRSFTDEVNRIADDNQLYHHTSDFTLYEIGTFDDVAGVLLVQDKPRLITRAVDVKNAPTGA
ncbi:MAG: nonstructural protein [Microviridae sp.]|nr:MAG: nonstructural protein [Microviridae sp.]